MKTDSLLSYFVINSDLIRPVALKTSLLLCIAAENRQ
jgi:hypothetical protein